MPIEKIAIIGSGLMGHGIAQVAAMSGQEVSLVDISDEVLRKATQRIRDSLNRLSEKGRIQESPEGVLKRIKTTTNLASAVNDTDYVIEAVPEDIGMKRKIASEVDAHAPKHAVLATNTSGLSVTVIAEATKRKEKVIGMHWMNPPQLMKLVEIAKSKYTDDETLQSTIGQCKRYGKETVIAQKDIWFFLAGRSHSGWSLEATLMYLRKEADIKEIDAVIKYKLGLPMGEFELMDFTGTVDIRPKGLESAEWIIKTYPEFEPWPIFLTMHRQLTKELWGPMSKKGLRGVKTGKGFYTYPEGKYVRPEIPEKLAGKFAPIQLLAPAINVAAWCVSNGVGSIDDVDKSFKLAYGWTKGIFEYINELGIENIIGVLRAREKQAPAWLTEFYRTDPLLRDWGG